MLFIAAFLAVRYIDLCANLGKMFFNMSRMNAFLHIVQLLFFQISFSRRKKKEVIKLGNGSSLPSDINNIYLLRSNKKLYDDAIKMMTF